MQAGVADLEAAMAAHPNDHLVIYGYSQGAVVANLEKRKLAEQYPAGTKAPDIDFVLGGDPNLPNGGFACPVPGPLHSDPRFVVRTAPRRPTPSSTRWRSTGSTTSADFPLYPLNVIALLNAVLGIVYVHVYLFDVSLPADPTKSPPTRAPTATPATTSSRPRTCRCSVRCAPWGCPSR